ncbi:MarR family transcriptional regulator [Lentzea alba]|uniref:MarR family winged helix-turn-helix transcriptional regulator n=1 Tax=Lentzea alba TaxID=2714351 RepID=UPI0039BFF243
MGNRGADDTDAEVESWRAMVPAIDPVVEGVVDRVHQISKYLDFLATEIAAPHGLNRADYEILARLFWIGPPHRLTPKQLANGTLSPATTITSRLDRLEKAGLVVRELDPSDRRSLPATLTDAGRAIFLDIVAGQAQREKELFTALPGADLENLRDLLRQVMEVLSGELGPAHRRTRLALDSKD